MNRDQKIVWMIDYCAKMGLTLTTAGEVGFGRECVGVLSGNNYPEYEWFDPNTYERIDQNGHVWTPKDAYHKGPYVAVLGTGEAAEAQLYEWLKWFDDNGFKLETGSLPLKPGIAVIQIAMGQDRFYRLVRPKLTLRQKMMKAIADMPKEGENANRIHIDEVRKLLDLLPEEEKGSGNAPLSAPKSDS